MNKGLRHRVLMLFSILTLLCFYGCIEIQSPEKDQVYTLYPDIELTFSKGAPADLTVTLNDQDITEYFDVQSTGAVAGGNDVGEFYRNGKNKLVASGGGNFDAVTFIVDLSGPTVHFTEVRRQNDDSRLFGGLIDKIVDITVEVIDEIVNGEGVPGGNSVVEHFEIKGDILVKGFVEDPSGVDRLEINGMELALTETDGEVRFEGTIADAQVFDVTARDANGSERRCQYANPKVSLQNALGVKVDAGALDFLEAEAAYQMSGDKLSDLIISMNPLQSGKIIGNSYQINAQSVQMGTPNFDMEILGEEGLRIQGNLPEMMVDIKVRINPIWPLPSFSVTGKVGARNVHFNSIADIDVQNGKIMVVIDQLHLDLQGMFHDIKNFPDWLIRPVTGLFERLIERILANQVKTILPVKVSDFINVFPESLIFDIMGKKIKPFIVPSDFSTDMSGIYFDMGTLIYSLEENTIDAIGSLYADAPPLPPAESVTPAGQRKDVGVVVSANMINQALSAAYEAGIMHMSVSQADIPELAQLGSGQDSFRVRLEPASPPEIQLIKSETTLGRFTMRDVTLNFDVKAPGESDFTLFFGTTVDVTASADINANPENDALVVTFDGVPQIIIRDINDSGMISIGDWGEAAIEDAVNQFTALVLPFVMDQIGAIPIPTIAGANMAQYTMRVSDIWVMDDAGHYLGFAGDLVVSHLPDDPLFAQAVETAMGTALDFVTNWGWARR